MPAAAPSEPERPQGRPSWLWLGPVVGEREMLDSPALSPAANRWQLGLLRALAADGLAIRVVSYLPERAWPRGPLWKPGLPRSPVPDLDVSSVGFLNVPGLRQGSLGRGHRRLIRRELAGGLAPSAIFTYNAPEGPARAALELQETLGIPWFAVVADVDGQASRASVDAYLERVHRAAGRVVLSWAVFQQTAREPRIHLDGGVTSVRPASAAGQSRAVLYTGMLGKHGGVDLLLRAFRTLPDPGTELWICGKLPSEEFLRQAGEDSRVRYFGAVTEAELVSLSDRAALFVNPRPEAIRESVFNFPSKILEYLSYAKPVVSTWTPGLAPEYREVLLVADDSSPASLARKITEVLAWGSQDRLAYGETVATFLREKRLWSVQATRLRRWVESLRAS